MSSCYSSWKTAKTGEEVPCFVNGKPSASLYNPKKEAAQFVELVHDGFIIIVGFATGLHITEVLNKYPTNKIIVVEKNDSSINFLRSSSSITFPNEIILCTPKTLVASILENYFPPLDGNFLLVPLRAWVDANTELFEEIKSLCNSALEQVSADISVQTHFGKLWHTNIIQNLTICENAKNAKLLDFNTSIFPTSKKAFVAGAGPGLEQWFCELKKNRDDYVIFSTDTAYHALSEQNIISDVVISIDAQHISHNHFMSNKDKRTIFAFDLCANPVAVKNLIRDNFNICYFKSLHPLSVHIDEWYYNNYNASFFPTIHSGSGTVSLAALQFAQKAGFAKIVTGGCDFAYIGGKMYASGIYMDSIFNAQANRLCSTDQYFTSLMYRSTLISEGENKTSNVLQRYKKEYESFFYEGQPTVKNDVSTTFNLRHKEPFPSKKYINFYKNELLKCMQSEDVILAHDVIGITILPYVSWYVSKNGEIKKTSEIYQIGLNATVHLCK